MPLDRQNNYAELIKALKLRYGNKHLQDVYCTQLKARQHHSGESLQEFEGSMNRLISLAHTAGPEDFRTRYAMQIFTDAVRDNEHRNMQVLRMGRHRNSA